MGSMGYPSLRFADSICNNSTQVERDLQTQKLREQEDRTRPFWWSTYSYEWEVRSRGGFTYFHGYSGGADDGSE